MSTIRGCSFPDELYYWVEKHLWVRPPDSGGVVRLGITPSGWKLAGGKIEAITPRGKSLGQTVAQGKAVAMMESSKYVGAVPAPLDGILLRVNDAVVADPSLPARDPYGEGWLAEMQPADWETASKAFATGAPALTAWQKLLEEQNISCA